MQGETAMKSNLRVMSIGAFFGAILFSVALWAADAAPGIQSSALLDRARKMDDSYVIVDVRSPEEFAKGHVPGAVNIPMEKMQERLQELMNAKNKNQDIVLYCHSGRRSAIAAETLRKNGFDKLLHMEGDMQKWSDDKLPIESSEK